MDIEEEAVLDVLLSDLGRRQTGLWHPGRDARLTLGHPTEAACGRLASGFVDRLSLRFVPMTHHVECVAILEPVREDA
ncbi:hypothetical protein ACFXEL_06110 [Streptomyces sp. NPDC059382]|uniref:hypothetical protein n=1 Tax=Streptomyces sp. NPDC059382 TaxID=3346816 RepID=UPI00369B76B6